MADKKGKAEGNDSDDNDGTENDESLCNRVIATLKEGGDLDSLSLKEHKAYLRNHGLRITGTKTVCQRRILEHWESDESVCNRVVAILKEGGELESLSLKELKAYLRNYGLRITGTKAVCQQRILEHWRDDTEEKEKEEDKGNNSDDNDGTENGESLCNRVITVLKEGSDLESLSLKELKAYLRNHGLHVTGTKAACQQRILEHWENDESVCKRVVTILKEGGDLESLSSKELKAYLRNHGLSITGSKAVCQQRILEHWSGDETTKEEEEEKGNDLDDRDQIQNSESLCNRVIAILKEGGDLESLSLKELKAYLRNHGLRIAGTKAVCQQRILEHWRIKEGNAEALYPRSSFFIDCTGDVCKGDVVLFNQKVYKKFDNISRRRLLGKRTIAGRVVKESYGKAKQQHTFTVEVLWSKGTKKLPLLFPLLVKGRNLYKSRTYRQRWCDEAERRNVIAEKHKRGKAARLVKAMERIRKWSADVGIKHQKHSHQSRRSQKRKASELEKGKIDKADGKAYIPSAWNTGNMYQVSSPVGQVKKKQKSMLRVSNTSYTVTSTGGCGSKDHLLRSCPRRKGATSVPSQSPTLTAHRRVRPGRKERLERKQKPVHSTEDTGVILHSNADAVLNSYQPQQSFHHQSAPHQFAGNDIGSTFHHQSAPHQFAGNDIGSTFHHQSAPNQFAGNDIGSTFHHQSAPHQFAGNDIGSTFHHQSAPNQFAGNDIGSTFHHQSAPHQFAGNDIGSTFHHRSAPCQFAGNDSAPHQF
ncbi:hypothetical protein HRI_000554000 [Hibiscus trionum]|uniref:SAP domain-containing protein n=1 Tax=Hibiscus trionum TaxID=183268 RepID=A0A9W7H1C0_HIBTR|nr:hypothetical protein HRI_000554000 [Hibiscus trionum]